MSEVNHGVLGYNEPVVVVGVSSVVVGGGGIGGEDSGDGAGYSTN